jgi:hypothetical protein
MHLGIGRSFCLCIFVLKAASFLSAGYFLCQMHVIPLLVIID